MAIKKITLSEFDRYKPARTALITTLTQEVDWFAIGTVVFEKTDKDWAYVVLGRDERGNFRAIKQNASIADQNEAKRQLLAAMDEFEKSGERVFPQGD